MKPRVIVEPAVEPFTLDQCRQHLRVEPYEIDSDGVGTHPDDWWILNVGLPAAREHCENFLGLSLAQQTLEYALDRFPTVANDGSVGVELPFGPVIEIVQVLVGDPGSDEFNSDSGLNGDGTLPLAEFDLDLYALPSMLWPTRGSWPSISGRNAIRIRYVAGYGVDSNGGIEMPKTIRAAILLTLGHLYEHRESVVERSLVELPLGVEALLRPHRTRLGMA